MTTKLQLAIQTLNAARANLAELQAARRATADSLAAIEAQIGQGAGIETPALFGHRRDRADLLTWLGERIGDAQAAVNLAEQRLSETRDAIRGTRRDLDALLARSAEQTTAAADLLAAAARVGDSAAALALADARQRLLEQEAQRLLDRLAELGEEPA
jgi:chromosome segregation ATPase